jgi:hypothetical protein
MSIICASCGADSDGDFDVDWCQNCGKPILGATAPTPQNLSDGLWSLDSSGEKFSGNVIDGLAEGFGTLISDESCSVGNFESGKLNGKCTVIYLYEQGYGNTFVGEIKNGIHSGYGKYLFNYPCFYEGFFKNFRYHGKGVRVFPDGTRYEGQFKDGVPHGRGIERYSDGSKYHGTFELGKKSGKGIETFLLGSIYQGDFCEGRFDGYGRFTFPTGEFWEGSFSNEWLNVRGGKEIFYTIQEKNGKKRFGQFQNSGYFNDYTSLLGRLINLLK